jgi:hypothetical protein
MKDAPRPDPVAAAQRVRDGVKDLARGALGAAGDLASDLADNYRKSSRYFRMRAAVIGTWVLLSAATLWAACPSSGPTNALGAEAQLLSRSDPGVLLGTQVFVANESRRVWTEVVLTLEGGWSYEKKTIRPGDKLVLSIAQFKKDGTAAPGELEPDEITIECEQGRVTALLRAR